MSSIRHSLRDELKNESKAVVPADLRTELSWTHYRMLVAIENTLARENLVQESLHQNINYFYLQKKN